MAWSKRPRIAAAVVAGAPLARGEMVGDFRVEAVIGEGGFGVVYRAEDVHMRRKAAVKVLHWTMAKDARLVERFFQEARAAAMLSHPNIITVYTCGRRPDGQPWIAYQFLDGGGLDRRMRTTGAMDVHTVIHILAPVASALHKAHGRGLIHRDIKPENIFLTVEEHDPYRAHVLDFGVAKLAGGEDVIHTETGIGVGTPRYMSPEQHRGRIDDERSIDGRADIYSLGVIAFEMLTGKPFWPEEFGAPSAILEMQIRGTRNPNPCAELLSIPPQVGAVIAKALAFEPNDRWADAPSFIAALAKASPPSEYGAADGRSDAMDIVLKVAPDIALTHPNAETIGHKLPELPVSEAATIRMGIPGAVPIVAPHVTPPPPREGRPLAVNTIDHAAPAIEPAAPALPAPARLPLAPRVTPPLPTMRRTQRRRLAAGIAAGASALAVIGLAVSAGTVRDDNAPGMVDARAPMPQPPSLSPGPSMGSLTITTEPAGASIGVNGQLLGSAPLERAFAVGDELEIRAELAGYTTAVDRVRLTSATASVRLVLAPLAVDAGVPVAPVDAGARSTRKRPPSRGSAFSLDDVIGE